MKPNDAAYIAHIRDAIDQIESYSLGHTYDQYSQNTWDQAAVARNLEIIGEAATQLTTEYKTLIRKYHGEKSATSVTC